MTDWIAAGLSLSAAAVWWVRLVDMWICRRNRWALGSEPVDHARLPSLSVIVAARDEADSIEGALRTLLASDCPGLEVIAVDDRSADGTGDRLTELAAQNGALRVVTVHELPGGWMGKQHALAVGARQATGDVLLFTDADVHFDPGALRHALATFDRRRLGFLCLFPECVVSGFWESLAVTFFAVSFGLRYQPWRVADARSAAHMGIGAFNMVRTDAYRAAGGHERLRMDVADDLKLGKTMKRSGARCACADSSGMVRVRWVRGVGGLAAGLTKNAFGAFDYRPTLAFGASMAVLAYSSWPLAGLFVGPLPGRLLSAVALAGMAVAARLMRPARNVSPWVGLAFPLAAPIMAYIVLRSMVVTLRDGGVTWRGTLYPLDELRRGLA